MKRTLACLVLGFVLSIAIAAQAQTPHEQAIQAAGKGSAPAPRAPNEPVNVETAVACTICFTCGGDWPLFEGSLPTAAGATERAGACFGPPGPSTDTSPFLCCR